jgi:glycosyltransferase involved in cell wall biosynthesis
MKILFGSVLGQMGGAEKVLLDLIRQIRRLRPGWELHLVALQTGPLTEAAEKCGVQIHSRQGSAPLASSGEKGFRLRALGQALRWIFFLRHLLRRLRPDLVQANGLKMQTLLSGAQLRRQPVIWHLHDAWDRRPRATQLVRWTISDRVRPVANSRFTAESFAKMSGYPAQVILNGVDLHEFCVDGERLDLDQLVGWPRPEKPVVRIGLVATFARWKGHELFLETAARLVGKAGLRFYVIGAPIYQTAGSQWSRTELERKLEALGLTQCCGLTGFVENVPAALRALDIVVHASTEPEPFGLAVAQAMACGRAVIASRAGGVTELFTEGVEACAFTPGRGDELGRLLESLAEDEARRSLLGRRARERMERDFSLERFGQEWIDFYESMER